MTNERSEHTGELHMFQLEKASVGVFEIGRRATKTLMALVTLLVAATILTFSSSDQGSPSPLLFGFSLPRNLAVEILLLLSAALMYRFAVMAVLEQLFELKLKEILKGFDHQVSIWHLRYPAVHAFNGQMAVAFPSPIRYFRTIQVGFFALIGTAYPIGIMLYLGEDEILSWRWLLSMSILIAFATATLLVVYYCPRSGRIDKDGILAKLDKNNAAAGL